MAINNLDIDYTKLNIDDCFKNHYVVPDYQREYVWEESQIEQLLTDVSDAFYKNPDKVYFLGMTVVYDGGSTLELIDGQQRITTFFIILCAVINIYKKNKTKSSVFENRIYSPQLEDDGTEVEKFSLQLQYQESTDCLSQIFHGNIPNDLVMSKLSLSDQRLYRAYETILKYLENEFTSFDELKKFAVYFFKKVQFVQIEANDISDALKIFETINERGVGLNPMDLLKNMIFMKVSRDDFTSLNKAWKAVIEQIEQINEKPLRFLRYFITSTYDITDEKLGIVKGILAEDKIYSWLMKNDCQCHYSTKPFEFVAALDDGIKRYTDFVKPNSTDMGNDYLKNVYHIAGSSYKGHIILLLAAKNMDETTMAKFKQVLEAIVYYYIVCRVKTNETEKLYAAWCPDIRRITNINELSAFVNGTVIPQINKWKNGKEYFENFMKLNLKTMQKYRIRYILSRITKYVDDIRGGGTKYADISKCYDNQYQIEHIMPQTCKEVATYGVTKEEFEYQDNLMGNLTLLEKTFNSSCKNASYDDKCKIYPNSCFYLTSSLPMLEDVGKNTKANDLNKRLKFWDSWNKKSIEERQKMMFDIAEEIWDLNKIISE